jgi:arylsulfatase A-like enzyme
MRRLALCLLLTACAPLVREPAADTDRRVDTDAADTDATDTDAALDTDAGVDTDLPEPLSLRVTYPHAGEAVALTRPLVVSGVATGAVTVTVTAGIHVVDAVRDAEGLFAVSFPTWDTDLVRVVAVADDGDAVVSEVPIAPNSPPTPGLLAVEPAAPTAGVALRATWTTSPLDVDGDAIAVRWAWARDGVAQPDLTTDTVPEGRVLGSEVWTATAHLSDRLQDAPDTSAEVTVLDTLPQGRVVMSPNPPRAGAPVRCDAADVIDPDGDVVTEQVSWFVNGAAAGAGPELNGLANFDEVRCALVLSTAPGDAPPRVAEAITNPDLPPQNVVVVVMDDVGAYDVGAYGYWPDQPRTPTIDALAAEGATFTRAWSNPLCSPSRGSLNTGRYPFRTGVGDNIKSIWEGFPLPLAETTIAEWLIDRAGYDTTAIGKWHLSSQADPQGPTPLEYGFAHHTGVPGNLDPGNYEEWVYTGSYFDWESWVDGVPEVQVGYLTVREVDDALDAMARMTPPFYLYVAVHAAHLPAHEPPGAVAPPSGWTGRERYKAAVEALDAELARLVAAVPADTTLVVVGDNGAPANLAPPSPYTQDELKGTAMEGGIRVPLIVRSPYIHTAGVRIDKLVHLVDLFPTIAELARAPVDGTLDLDGRSLVDFLIDPSRPDPRGVVYAERFEPSGPVANATLWERAIRDDRYKVVRSLGYQDACYDLGRDFREGEDLLRLGTTTPEELAACDALSARLDTLDVR